MQAFWTLSSQLKHTLLVLFAAGLCFWASLASQLPTLPLYIQDVGGTDQQIGVVMGAFAIGLLGARNGLGKLADRHSRKMVLLIGLSVAAIAPLCYFAVTNIAILIVVRAFHGISIAAFTTAYTTLVVDLSPRHRRGTLIGYMSLVNPLGVAIGPALGGLLQAEMGYGPLFLLAAGLGAVGLLCGLFVKEPPTPQIPPSPDTTHQTEHGVRYPFWSLLNAPRMRVPSLVMLMIGLTFGAMATFVPLLIRETLIPLNVGLFYTATAIASFGVRILFGRASDRFGRGRFISLGLLCYTLAMIGLWTAHSPFAFLAAGLCEGCGAGIVIPMMAALMADRSQPYERGRIFSLCMGGFDLGIAISGPVLGTLAEYIGVRHVFGLATSYAGFALLLFLTHSSKNLAHSLRFALGRAQDIYALDGSD